MLMEALQMLKFSLKQKRLNFMEGWITSECDMQEAVDDEPDLLATLSSGTKSSIDRVIVAVCQDDENKGMDM